MRAYGSGTAATTVKLLDKATGNPVPYAHMRFLGLQQPFEKTTISGEMGKATVSLEGPALLSVSYVGYIDHYDTIVPGSTKTLYLRSSVFNMEEVVITGQYTPERSDRSIYKIESASDAEQIAKSALNNLQEILSSELNFRISQDNISGKQSEFTGCQWREC
ncbi:MAG: hypothetical protein U5L09_05080 [Bacteroidales bacterium]|nr:hypothetical protein [Bacteroidales bacterium]